LPPCGQGCSGWKRRQQGEAHQRFGRNGAVRADGQDTIAFAAPDGFDAQLNGRRARCTGSRKGDWQASRAECVGEALGDIAEFRGVEHGFLRSAPAGGQKQVVTRLALALHQSIQREAVAPFKFNGRRGKEQRPAEIFRVETGLRNGFLGGKRCQFFRQG
jgi:hypothetical protein